MDNKGTLIAALVLGSLAIGAFLFASLIVSFEGEDAGSPGVASGSSPLEDDSQPSSGSPGNVSQPSRVSDSPPAVNDPIGALPSNWNRLNVAEKSYHNPYNCLEAIRIRDDNGRCMVGGSSVEYIVMYQLTPQQTPAGEAAVIAMAVSSAADDGRASTLFSYLESLRQRGVLSDSYEIDAKLYDYADVRYVPVDANDLNRNWQIANQDSPRRTHRLGSQSSIPPPADDQPSRSRAELEAYLEDARISDANKHDALKEYCLANATAGECLVWNYYDSGVEHSERRQNLCQAEEVLNEGFCGSQAAHERWSEFRNEAVYLEAEGQSQPAEAALNPDGVASRLSDQFFIEQRAAVRWAQNDLQYYFLSQ